MHIRHSSFRFLFWLFLFGVLFGLAMAGGKNQASVLNALHAAPEPKMTVRPLADSKTSKMVPNGAQYVSLFRFYLKSEAKTTLNQLGFYQTLGNPADIVRGHLAVQGNFVRETPLLQQENGLLSWDNLQIPFSKNSELFFEIMIDLKKEVLENAFLRFEFRGTPTLKLDTTVTASITVSSFAADTVTIKNPASSLKLPLSTGKDQTIGRFSIKAGNHDILLKRIKLGQAEQIDPKKLSNIRLVSQNVLLSKFSRSDGSSPQALDFAMKETLIKKKKERSFSLIADIKDARKIEHLRFFLETPSDLFVQDVEFGSGASVMNQWGLDQAWCLGASKVQCPQDGFRKKCTKAQIKMKEVDCVP